MVWCNRKRIQRKKVTFFLACQRKFFVSEFFYLTSTNILHLLSPETSYLIRENFVWQKFCPICYHKSQAKSDKIDDDGLVTKFLSDEKNFEKNFPTKILSGEFFIRQGILPLVHTSNNRCDYFYIGVVFVISAQIQIVE